MVTKGVACWYKQIHSLTVKTVKKVDKAVDAGKAVSNFSDAAKTVKKTDFFVTPMGDAIPATSKGFFNNLSKMELKGTKYYGYDSRGPIRVRVEKHLPTPGYKGPYNPFHCEPHFHIDRRINGSSGKFRKIYTGLIGWLK